MSEFLGYLRRANVRPDPDDLTERELRHIRAHVQESAGDLVVDDVPIPWSHVDEVEVVRAARERGPSGWLVRRVMGDDRYHLGVYYGPHEAVLPNISLRAAEYLVRLIAYYAPGPVRYRGIEGLAPLAPDPTG